MANITIGSITTANLMLGTAQVQRVALGTVQVWANEVVVVLGNTVNVVLKTLFTAPQWADANLKKRVVVPAGVQIGATQGGYAIATTISGDGQAGSFAGELRLVNNGTISGIGGAPNSGVGGTAMLGNFLGRAGQKLIIDNYGTIRAGGGAGGWVAQAAQVFGTLGVTTPTMKALYSVTQPI